ncbi:MAG: hypothetical protein WCY01_06220 [Alkalispirochaeta sp.]
MKKIEGPAVHMGAEFANPDGAKDVLMTDSSTLRQRLRAYLDSSFVRVPMNLRDLNWHLTEKIPSEPGWYLIETDIPIKVLRVQRVEKRHYFTKAGKKLPSNTTI